MDYFEIGQRIRRFRKAHGYSQEELAEKVGISTTHMSHIETGNTKLSLPVLVLLAEALEVKTDDMLFDNADASYAVTNNEIMKILECCTPKQLRFLKDLILSATVSMNKYLC